MASVIPLTRGQVTIVDDEDFDLYSKVSWYALPSPNGYYAARDFKEKKSCMLHDLISLDVYGPSESVDHANHDTLDNRRLNLRPCTRSQNMCNRRGPASHNTSGYLGVYYRAERGKFVGYVTLRHKRYQTKLCATAEEAAMERDVLALKIQREFASLNKEVAHR